MSTRKAIVIGAGPMGLSTAYYLQKRGWTVEVLEADDRIGGMSAHFDFDGLDVERYYHFLCKTDDALMGLLGELGLADAVRWNTTRMGFFYDGEMFEWGRPDALLRFPHLGKREKIRYALHVLRARTMSDWRQLEDVEATGWIRRWLGDRAYEMLWARSFDLKFFEHAESISAAWIATRIRRVSMSRRDAFHEEMGFIEGGSLRFLEALRQQLEAGGATIAVNSPVEGVTSEGGTVTGVIVDGKPRTADCVISTAPLKVVPRLVPQLTPSERSRIEALDNIGVVCVKLKLSERYSPYFWVNVNDDRIHVPGVIEYTNLNPLASHIVYVPYYLPATHERWAWEGSAFEADARSVLSLIRPDWDPATVEAVHVSRYRYAQPICTPGFAAKLPPMTTSIAGFYMADTSYCYPEDRSITESVGIAQRLAATAGSA